MISIRRYQPNDLADLLAIIGPVLRAGDTYAIEPNLSNDGYLAYWTAPGHHVFMAEEAGVVCGTYYLKRNFGGGGSHVCNCGYITAPRATGRGVARAMLAHSLETARAMGFRAMQYNSVISTNARAIATWRRAGFAEVGRLPAAFLHPTHGYVDALVMMKSLTGPE